MMNDFRKNAEGYNDPTPYNAIKNIGCENQVNAGEIWECSTGYNELKMFLVLKVIKKVALVLALNEEMKCEDDIEVICKGIRFTTPYMISYKFEKGFVNYVKSMKEDEFATLLDVVRGHLGFEEDGNAFEEAAHEMVNELKMKLEEEQKARTVNENALKLTIRNLKEENDELKNQPVFQPDPEEVVKLKAQVEMLERQNERLLDRLIG